MRPGGPPHHVHATIIHGWLPIALMVVVLNSGWCWVWSCSVPVLLVVSSSILGCKWASVVLGLILSRFRKWRMTSSSYTAPPPSSFPITQQTHGPHSPIMLNTPTHNLHIAAQCTHNRSVLHESSTGYVHSKSIEVHHVEEGPRKRK